MRSATSLVLIFFKFSSLKDAMKLSVCLNVPDRLAVNSVAKVFPSFFVYWEFSDHCFLNKTILFEQIFHVLVMRTQTL